MLDLPLNFIPVVGTALFIILQGKRFGPGAHARYFQLKGFTEKQKEEWVEERKAAYTRYVCIFTQRSEKQHCGVLPGGPPSNPAKIGIVDFA